MQLRCPVPRPGERNADVTAKHTAWAALFTSTTRHSPICRCHDLPGLKKHHCPVHKQTQANSPWPDLPPYRKRQDAASPNTRLHLATRLAPFAPSFLWVGKPSRCIVESFFPPRPVASARRVSIVPAACSLAPPSIPTPCLLLVACLHVSSSCLDFLTSLARSWLAVTASPLPLLLSLRLPLPWSGARSSRTWSGNTRTKAPWIPPAPLWPPSRMGTSPVSPSATGCLGLPVAPLLGHATC